MIRPAQPADDTVSENEYIIVPRWRADQATYVFIAEQLPGDRNDGTIVRMLNPAIQPDQTNEAAP